MKKVTEIRVTEIEATEIRATEIRISSNHRELHGAIFIHALSKTHKSIEIVNSINRTVTSILNSFTQRARKTCFKNTAVSAKNKKKQLFPKCLQIAQQKK